MDKPIGEVLEIARQWARSKLATGEEPPWAWYQYMKLVETIDAIVAGQRATKQPSPEDSPESAQHQETALPQGAEVLRIDSARSRRDQTDDPRLPM